MEQTQVLALTASTINDPSLANVINVVAAKQLTLSSVTSELLQSSTNLDGSFIYSAYSSLIATITDTTISCLTSYSSTSTTSYSAVFYLANTQSITTKNNTISYCNYGTSGIFYLSKISSFADSGSTYFNNSGATGSIYYILGSVIN